MYFVQLHMFVLDAFSRRVIGWALEGTLQDELTMAALQMTLDSRSPGQRSGASLRPVFSMPAAITPVR